MAKDNEPLCQSISKSNHLGEKERARESIGSVLAATSTNSNSTSC